MILGRVFRTAEAKTSRVLVHLSTNGETLLFEKFILPNIGLDMPIYQLTISTEDGTAVLELVDKRRINRLLQTRYNFVAQMQQEET